MTTHARQFVCCIVASFIVGTSIHAQEATGTLVFGGRKFTVAAPIKEWSPVIDTEYGVLTYTHHQVQLPIAVNGEKIYKAKEVKPAMPLPGQPNIAEWLALGLKQDLLTIVGADSAASLRIDMRHVVTDAYGKVIFYRNRGAWLNPRKRAVREFARNSTLSQKIDSLMGHVPAMQPAMYKGQPAAALLPIHPMHYRIDIQVKEDSVTAVYDPVPEEEEKKK